MLLSMTFSRWPFLACQIFCNQWQKIAVENTLICTMLLCYQSTKDLLDWFDGMATRLSLQMGVPQGIGETNSSWQYYNPDTRLCSKTRLLRTQSWIGWIRRVQYPEDSASRATTWSLSESNSVNQWGLLIWSSVRSWVMTRSWYWRTTCSVNILQTARVDTITLFTENISKCHGRNQMI